MPQELPLITARSNQYGSYRPPAYDNYPQFTNNSKPQSPQKPDNNVDFHRFYGPVSSNTLNCYIIIQNYSRQPIETGQ